MPAPKGAVGSDLEAISLVWVDLMEVFCASLVAPESFTKMEAVLRTHPFDVWRLIPPRNEGVVYLHAVEVVRSLRQNSRRFGITRGLQ